MKKMFLSSSQRPFSPCLFKLNYPFLNWRKWIVIGDICKVVTLTLLSVPLISSKDYKKKLGVNGNLNVSQEKWKWKWKCKFSVLQSMGNQFLARIQNDSEFRTPSCLCLSSRLFFPSSSSSFQFLFCLENDCKWV